MKGTPIIKGKNERNAVTFWKGKKLKKCRIFLVSIRLKKCQVHGQIIVNSKWQNQNEIKRKKNLYSSAYASTLKTNVNIKSIFKWTYVKNNQSFKQRRNWNLTSISFSVNKIVIKVMQKIINRKKANENNVSIKWGWFLTIFKIYEKGK